MLGLVRSNLRDYLMLPLVGLVSAGVVTGVGQGLRVVIDDGAGSALAALASAVIAAYAGFVNAHLSGQAYRRAVEIQRLAAPSRPLVVPRAGGSRSRAR